LANVYLQPPTVLVSAVVSFLSLLLSAVDLVPPGDESLAVAAPVLCVLASLHAEGDEAAAQHAACEAKAPAREPAQRPVLLADARLHARAAVRADGGHGIVREDAGRTADDENAAGGRLTAILHGLSLLVGLLRLRLKLSRLRLLRLRLRLRLTVWVRGCVGL
jgi:hypothetical protein